MKPPDMVTSTPIGRQRLHDDLERVRADLHQIVAATGPTELRQRSNGTRWTNGQLLWHMAFGFLIVSRLLPLVRMFGRLPDGFSRAFAAVLNAGTRLFHSINYVGSVGGALVFHGPRLTRRLDHTIARLHRRLDAESAEALARRMHFPLGWDPFFRDTMTVADVYAYGMQHYDFHRKQLTIEV
jgi:DinB family protein